MREGEIQKNKVRERWVMARWLVLATSFGRQKICRPRTTATSARGRGRPLRRSEPSYGTVSADRVCQNSSPCKEIDSESSPSRVRQAPHMPPQCKGDSCLRPRHGQIPSSIWRTVEWSRAPQRRYLSSRQLKATSMSSFQVLRPSAHSAPGCRWWRRQHPGRKPPCAEDPTHGPEGAPRPTSL